jgi:hypothetical protein
VYQFSPVKLSKKYYCNICIALLATGKSVEQSTIHNKPHRINQKKHTKKTPNLILPNLEIHSLKKTIKYERQYKCQMMAVQGKGFNTYLTNT